MIEGVRFRVVNGAVIEEKLAQPKGGPVTVVLRSALMVDAKGSRIMAVPGAVSLDPKRGWRLATLEEVRSRYVEAATSGGEDEAVAVAKFNALVV